MVSHVDKEAAKAPTAFQINRADNVATALLALPAGSIAIIGDASMPRIDATEDIPAGHKIAIRDIAPSEDIIKYGVAIGRASTSIARGSWVHLHCMGSKYDEKSNQFDPLTGTAKDTRY